MPKHNPDKLSIIYDKKQKDFVIKFPRKCDLHLIMNHILKDVFLWDPKKMLNWEKYQYNEFNLTEELEKRGYDLKTLKFSIELKSDISK